MDPSETKSKLICKEFMGRINEVLQSGVISDCTFHVGQEPDQELISANKSLLAVTSPVFEAMFYGSLAEKKHPILVPDICPVNFKILLSYMSTDEITMTSIKQAGELYYSAKKLMLPHLQQRCSDYLTGKLGYSTACCVYEYGQLFEDDVLKVKATDMMSRDTVRVLNDPSFLEIKISTLIHLFSLDKLNIETEIDLLEAAVRYNEARANVMMTENDLGEKTESSIQEAIENIRFLNVSPKEFADCKVKASLLSESEILAIILNITSPDTDVPYPKKLCNSRVPRKKYEFSFTYDIDHYGYNTITSSEYKANNFTWKIIVNRNGNFLGIFLSCNPSNKEPFNWSCKAKCQLKVISHSHTPSETIVSANTFEFNHSGVMFGNNNNVICRDWYGSHGYLKFTVEAYVTNYISYPTKQ